MNVPILYLGPEGTHSHEAVLRRFGPKAKLVPCLSHHEIFSRLCAARARPRPLAIVPVENSSEGPVTQTLDQLADHAAVGILDSFSLPVPQHLMALPGTQLAGIRRVCSHPQVLGQCRATLARLLPRAELVPDSSTAVAAGRAAQDPETAAIASDAAAKIHRLAVLRKNMQDSRHNVTRFFTLTAAPVPQHLLALPGTKRSGIRRICSHPQVLGQCRATLARLFPRAELIPDSSTAAAAGRAALDPATAAIASEAAAKIHHLAVLRMDMQDSDENVTRFFTITVSRVPTRAAGKAKELRSLVYLVIGNRPGALLHVLAPFDASDVNLTFIQSRPLPGRPWEYGFFIEAATDWKSARAQAAWKMVLALAESGRKIGTYPVA